MNVEKLSRYKSVKRFSKALKYSGNLSTEQKIDFWNILGKLYNKERRYYFESKCYEKILEADPENNKALEELGRTYYKLGNLEKTIEYYEKVLERNPDNLIVSNCLTLARVQLLYA